MKKMFKHLSNQRGVTLIELIVVIVILGLIAAIAIPSVVGYISTAETNADESTFSIVDDAVQRYIIDNPSVVPSTATVDILIADLVANGYLSKTPTVPSSDPVQTFVSATIDTTGSVTQYTVNDGTADSTIAR